MDTVNSQKVESTTKPFQGFFRCPEWVFPISSCPYPVADEYHLQKVLRHVKLCNLCNLCGLLHSLLGHLDQQDVFGTLEMPAGEPGREKPLEESSKWQRWEVPAECRGSQHGGEVSMSAWDLANLNSSCCLTVKVDHRPVAESASSALLDSCENQMEKGEPHMPHWASWRQVRLKIDYDHLLFY